MADDGNKDSDANSLVSAPVGVGDPSADKRRHVDPERVEGGQTGRSTLVHAKSSRLAIRTTGTGAGSRRERLLNKVGEDDSAAVVGETLCQLDVGDQVGTPRNAVGDTPKSVALLLGRELVTIVRVVLKHVRVRDLDSTEGVLLLIGGGLRHNVVELTFGHGLNFRCQ